LLHLLFQISEIEQSQESAEAQFSKAQEAAGLVHNKEKELQILEEKCSAIEGLESPSTLDAKLTTVRGKWKQVPGYIHMFHQLIFYLNKS